VTTPRRTPRKASGQAGVEPGAETRAVRASIVVLFTGVLACGGGASGTSAAEPAPPTGETPPPTPTPTPTPTPNPSADPTVSLERLDPASECDGLVPDRAPAAVTVTTSPPSGLRCGGGFSDGTGHVAVSMRSGDETRWQVFAPDGKAAQGFAAEPVVPEPSGWHGLRVSPASVPSGGSVVEQVAHGPDGALRREHTVSFDPVQVQTNGWSLAQDPAGGCFVLVANTDNAHNHWGGLRGQRFDAGGAPRFAPELQFGARSDSRVFFLAAGVSSRGESLAIWQQSAWVDVAWFDRTGGSVPGAARDLSERQADALGPAGLTPRVELLPLLDGGLAVRVDGAFRRRYGHLATTTSPLPEWLAARATGWFRFTRGNAGYAVFPPAGQDATDCAQTIELRAPSGRLCGRVVLRADPPRACVTGAVDQGWDGTVVRQDALETCTWRFWPALLAR
jgi:hypothetical protein